MDFGLSDEQAMVKEAAQRVVAERYGFQNRERNSNAADNGWVLFGELGWLALGIEEEFGGIPDADVELMLLAEAFGRGLVHEPFYSTVVLCAQLLGDLADQQKKQDLLPRIVTGEIKLAFAHAEPRKRYDLADLSAEAKQDGDSFILNGRKSVVFDAPFADYLLVSANMDQISGVSLFLVDQNAEGVGRQDFTTTDGGQASEIAFADVKLENTALIGPPGKALAAIEAAADRMVAVACADAIGAMDVLMETTAEYLKTRQQFGTPIGKFQALQHRMADMFASLELARSMAIYANLKLRAPVEERKTAVSLAKMQLIETAQLIGRQAIQLHGGIGMTNEFHVGHYFKRLIAFETLFGDANHHASRVEALTA